MAMNFILKIIKSQKLILLIKNGYLNMLIILFIRDRNFHAGVGYESIKMEYEKGELVQCINVFGKSKSRYKLSDTTNWKLDRDANISWR